VNALINFRVPQNEGNFLTVRDLSASQGLLISYLVSLLHIIIIIIIFTGSAGQRGLWPPRHTRFLDHTQRRDTVVKTPLDEGSASRRRKLYIRIRCSFVQRVARETAVC
jgi:hypothetical protein